MEYMEYTGVYWDIQEYMEYMEYMEYTGVYWDIQEYTGV